MALFNSTPECAAQFKAAVRPMQIQSHKKGKAARDLNFSLQTRCCATQSKIISCT